MYLVLLMFSASIILFAFYVACLLPSVK